MSIYRTEPVSPWFSISEKYGRAFYNPEERFNALSGEKSSLSFIANGLTAQYLLDKQAEITKKFFFRPAQMFLIARTITLGADIKKMIHFAKAAAYYLFSSAKQKINGIFAAKEQAN